MCGGTVGGIGRPWIGRSVILLLVVVGVRNMTRKVTSAHSRCQ